MPGPMLNAIAFWNATYMQAIIDTMTAEGRTIEPELIACVSLQAHGHTNFLGRYAFMHHEAVARGELRPLRNPNSEWDFRKDL